LACTRFFSLFTSKDFSEKVLVLSFAINTLEEKYLPFFVEFTHRTQHYVSGIRNGSPAINGVFPLLQNMAATAHKYNEISLLQKQLAGISL
jgi:hypothetical protein